MLGWGFDLSRVCGISSYLWRGVDAVQTSLCTLTSQVRNRTQPPSKMENSTVNSVGCTATETVLVEAGFQYHAQSAETESHVRSLKVLQAVMVADGKNIKSYSEENGAARSSARCITCRDCAAGACWHWFAYLNLIYASGTQQPRLLTSLLLKQLNL